MGMLNKEDLRQIGDLFDQKFVVVKKELAEEITARVVAGVGEMIEQNVLPQFDEIREEMKTGFDRLDRRIERVDGKVNAVVNVLKDKRVFTEEDKALIMS
jgi:arginyl-tRNA synthetase